jgi:hypothetical protein
MAKGVSEKMHEEAMASLGWRMDRYMNALKTSSPGCHAMEENALKSSANLERMLEFDSSMGSHIVHESVSDGDNFGHRRPQYPLGVLRRMEAREKFVVGVLESTYAIDQSIQENEYLYLRRLRLLIGVSNAEFSYFAEKSGFADQSADRAKLEAGKRKAEDDVVGYLEKHMMRIQEQVPKVLERCFLTMATAEDKRACKLSLHNQERIARTAEKNREDAEAALLVVEDENLTEQELQQRHEDFLSLAYEFKKYCDMSEKSAQRDTLYTQLNRELDWWQKHHKVRAEHTESWESIERTRELGGGVNRRRCTLLQLAQTNQLRPEAIGGSCNPSTSKRAYQMSLYSFALL